MRESTEIVLMNLSKMAGGTGDINHGKQVIFEMHNVDWLNAQTRIKELDLKQKEFDYITKPLIKGITLPPFINTPTDLSAGEFATIMGALESFSRMSGGGVMNEMAEAATKRTQSIIDKVRQKHTGANGITDEGRVATELTLLYNDPLSDYRKNVDIASFVSYTQNPGFDANGEAIPYEDIPEGAKKIPWTTEWGLFNGQFIAKRWFNLLFKVTGQGQELEMPPSLGPSYKPQAGAETKSEIDLKALEEY